ncbi:hypothetical protein DSO57_1016501 [Entomophthora muscae]|uniref:Uncharacterized protein n=1 Tax=Entomophthora muscae TaxID=34485 RepID=A0ACC2UDM8_9FUNG|nr:hypothetical protein DSO57_1016501 [Entomophthora muscae]
MPINYYLIAGIVYFCSNLIILFASICESITQYKLAYPYLPGHTPVVLAKLPRALDLEYFHPHHLDLPPVMKDIPTTPPLPDAPPTQDFSKLGLVYITVLGLANQVVPHTGSWLLATALNYLVCIASIVYMAFQAWPASPVGDQPDSGMDCDTCHHLSNLARLSFTWCEATYGWLSTMVSHTKGWIKKLAPQLVGLPYVCGMIESMNHTEKSTAGKPSCHLSATNKYWHHYLPPADPFDQ